MRKKKPEQELQGFVKQLIQYHVHWRAIEANGCNDPFWPDGMNMNLERNHIIYEKRNIRELCAEQGLAIPEEYYQPTPPKVSDQYMANLDQKERVERMRQYGYCFKAKKIEYEDDQMTLI